MKVRVTFIHDPVSSSSDWDPAQQLSVSKKALTINEIQATVREDHLTLNQDELPADVWNSGLKHASSFHLRWQSLRPVKTVDPYASRVPGGLHIFYSGKPGSSTEDSNICPLLRKLFSSITKCESPSTTFNSAPVLSPRFTSSSSQQYYQLVPSISSFADYVEDGVCSKTTRKGSVSSQACSRLVESIRAADVLDVDYSALSHSLTLRSTQFSPAKRASETVPALPGARVEVGVLSLQDEAPGGGGSAASGEEEDNRVKLSMGGLLTVVGEDGRASPTLFGFPSRHHAAVGTLYNVSFNSPTGLHPTMRVSFPKGTLEPPVDTVGVRKRKGGPEVTEEDGSSEKAPAKTGRTCALHAQLSLPSFIFPDKYQLSAPNFLAANNLKAIRSLTSPPPDLEAPDWAVDTWGSNMLLELAPPSSSSAWHADIPLHLRYLAPIAGGQRPVEVAWPAVFWACTSSDGSKMSVNPFDREDLGYDRAFGPRTVFYHLDPTRGDGDVSMVERISVPVLNEDGLGFGFLRQGTSMVLLLGLVWVAWKLVYVVIANKEAGSLSKLAEKERVDDKGKAKEKAQ